MRKPGADGFRKSPQVKHTPPVSVEPGQGKTEVARRTWSRRRNHPRRSPHGL